MRIQAMHIIPKGQRPSAILNHVTWLRLYYVRTGRIATRLACKVGGRLFSSFVLFAPDQGKRLGAVQVPGGVAAFPVRFARLCFGSLFGSGAEL